MSSITDKKNKGLILILLGVIVLFVCEPFKNAGKNTWEKQQTIFDYDGTITLAIVESFLEM